MQGAKLIFDKLIQMAMAQGNVNVFCFCFFENTFSHGYKLCTGVCLRYFGLKNVYFALTLLVVCTEEIGITNTCKKKKQQNMTTWAMKQKEI